MSVIKTGKNIFNFLWHIFVKIFSIIGVLLIIVGSLGLFFSQESHGKVLYLILASVGYVVIAMSSLLNLSAMNQKEIKPSH
jgi:hypothetical protein